MQLYNENRYWIFSQFKAKFDSNKISITKRTIYIHNTFGNERNYWVPFCFTNACPRMENRIGYGNTACSFVHGERKMEKVISLLAPLAGSANGRLVPRPAKKRKEAARPLCCARSLAYTRVYDRSASINGYTRNCRRERSLVSSRWNPKKREEGTQRRDVM